MILPADASVVRKGVRAARAIAIRYAMLRVQRFGGDGRRQIVNLLLTGAVVGTELDDRVGYAAEACTGVTLLQLRLPDFKAPLSRGGALPQAVIIAHSRRLERMRWLTLTIGALAPTERF
ncbi:hypothetical protein [Cereibacter sphaeroides]|uniref:hypothetical protein n=1 Tax=Cereibacter sphaeroides TaxID=1063 RepID=UPI001F202425|nr:hypothetical protein [Cereibacter sphaeroides]MCE6967255.1 hypothetical protein [Cereibacter sphaeroides]